MSDAEFEHADETWDAGDLACGELINELRRRVKLMQPRQTLHLIAQDAGARLDIAAWCRITRHVLRRVEYPHYLIERKDD